MSESDSTRKNFPDWENLYKSQTVETMPWYNENFDSDLERELDQRKIIANGKKFLDLGTGPATQAIWLAKRGFNVIGSDLAEAAINRARKLYAREKNVNFIVDDILNTKFKSDEFDYIFDRGCFHVLLPRDRKEYINKIKQILKGDGMLFLKCFSDKESMEDGPYKFSQTEIRAQFSELFIIDSIKETVYQGTLNPFPRAFFVVMIKSGQ
ncbi:MAG TPA: class I SAM-dependent methyltransferase [Candidatus Bathyarchaeia archaeon]|nr:class I SAM-dependent methyltransferase [Candidatus Bathyarchaeia archaeon]